MIRGKVNPRDITAASVLASYAGQLTAAVTSAGGLSMETTGEWDKALLLTEEMAKRAPKAVQYAIRNDAYSFMRRVQMSFRKGGPDQGQKWSPISIITREMRKNAGKAEGQMGRPLGSSTGANKPLLRTGFLRRSVTIQQVADGFFVGVHRTAGPNALNVAQIHEMGPTIIPITQKMRGFFMRLYLLGVLTKLWPPKNKSYIVIPRRSFLEDIFKEHVKGSEERVTKWFWNYVMTGRVSST